MKEAQRESYVPTAVPYAYHCIRKYSCPPGDLLKDSIKRYIVSLANLEDSHV